MSLHIHASRRTFITSTALAAAGALVTALMPQPAIAYDEQSVSALNLDAKGVALKGYDPVSYFSAGGPAQGKSDLSANYEGATYWFTTGANRDAFKANPSKYAPAYGGFCAMGVAMEKKLDVDPQLWRIVDGKLYLNVHKAAQTRWLEDVPGNIERAERIWPRIKDKAPKTL